MMGGGVGGVAAMGVMVAIDIDERLDTIESKVDKANNAAAGETQSVPVGRSMELPLPSAPGGGYYTIDRPDASWSDWWQNAEPGSEFWINSRGQAYTICRKPPATAEPWQTCAYHNTFVVQEAGLPQWEPLKVYYGEFFRVRLDGPGAMFLSVVHSEKG